ncbi:MAG: response regulator, partial [Planctomycetota bacterium]
MSIRVLVADDHEVVRRGLKTLFQDTDIEIVAEASKGNESVDRTVQPKPDVVIMDMLLPKVHG